MSGPLILIRDADDDDAITFVEATLSRGTDPTTIVFTGLPKPERLPKGSSWLVYCGPGGAPSEQAPRDRSIDEDRLLELILEHEKVICW